MRDYPIEAIIFVLCIVAVAGIFVFGWENGAKSENRRLFEQCLEINSTMQYAEAKNLCTEFVKR